MTEILKSFMAKQQWWTLAVFDIKQRYRRSTIGPLWITLSTGIMIGSIGLLWATLFKMPLHNYLPSFASGLIIWMFISSQLNEACTTYPQFQGYIKQLNLPHPIYVLRVWARNIIMFAHNSIVFVLVWLLLGVAWIPNLFLALTGFIVVSLIIFFVSLPLASICTRYRDMPQIIQSMTQVLYFFTPVMWTTKSLPEGYMWVANLNPFYHMIELVRAPLLGAPASLNSWICSLFILFFSVLIGSSIHDRFKKRIAYWL